MIHKTKHVVLAALLLWGCTFASARALTYSEAAGAGQGKVLGATATFYPYPTGTLVNDSGTVYFISGTTKVPFTNWKAFTGLGYQQKNIVEGDLTNYALATGYSIGTADTTHPWGSWVIYQGTVYYSTQSGLIGVPSAQAFTSNGGDWTNIVKANPYDVAALKAGPNLPPMAVGDSRVTLTPTYPSSSTSDNSTGSSASGSTGGSTGSSVNPTTPSTASIVVTSPTSGQQWTIGSTQTIRWTAPSSVTAVNISVTPYFEPTSCATASPCAQPALALAPIPVAVHAEADLGVFTWSVGTPGPGAIQTSTLATGNYVLIVSDESDSTRVGYVHFKMVAAGTTDTGTTTTETPRVGKLVSISGTIYYVGTAGLYGIPSTDVFKSWGWSFSSVLPANVAEQSLQHVGTVPMKKDGCSSPVDQINGHCGTSTTPPVTSTATPRVGQAVSINGTVYYVTQNGLYGFPDSATFLSWGFTFSQVLTANSAEVALPILGKVPAKSTGCNSIGDAVKGTCGSSPVVSGPQSISLSAAVNPSFTVASLPFGSTNQKIASFILSIPSTEGVSLSAVTINPQPTGGLAGSSNFGNIYVKVGDSQFGQTVSNVAADTGVTFTATTPVVLTAGRTVTVNVYADAPIWSMGTPPTRLSPGVILVGCAGTGATDSATVGCNSVNGQNVYFTGSATNTSAGTSASGI